MMGNNAYRSHYQYKSIALVLCNGVSDFRMKLAARGLELDGYHVEVLDRVELWQIAAHDLFIFCRPGIGMLDAVNLCLSIGKRVIVDMDDDFNSIPRNNPAYPYIGAGCANGDYLKRLNAIIQHPNVSMTYASAELENRYNKTGTIIGNPWDDENPRWDVIIDHAARNTITIGWAGTATHMQDFLIPLPSIKRVMNENPDVNIMIGGDAAIYNLFAEYPDHRKTHIPFVPYDVYPIMLQRSDIWIAPLEDTHFNRAKSNIKLVDAMAGRVPWLASPLPQYEEIVWMGTGALVGDHEWYEALQMAVARPDFRNGCSFNAETQRLVLRSYLYGLEWAMKVEGVLQ